MDVHSTLNRHPIRLSAETREDIGAPLNIAVRRIYLTKNLSARGSALTHTADRPPPPNGGPKDREEEAKVRFMRPAVTGHDLAFYNMNRPTDKTSFPELLSALY